MKDVCEKCGVYRDHGGYCDTCAWLARARLEVDALAWVAGGATLECLDTVLSAVEAVNERVARLEAGGNSV